MSDTFMQIEGVKVPRLFYGTAWKEDNTQRLTELALQQGFRGIDTANQRRHYHEEAVGLAIKTVIANGLVSRNDLFIQTKYTSRGGQDHRLPYDPNAPVAVQVEQSFASSLTHFGTDVIDSYVLHGPTQRAGLGASDWEAWRAMESIHASGRARLLGVSNVSLEQLKTLCDAAKVRPRLVQNRCYAVRAWDRDIRVFCAANGIVYQGFSLLTANRDVMASSVVIHMARHYNRTAAQIIFRFALELGMIVLTGTTDPGHMREDLDAHQFKLVPDEVARIEGLMVE
jgi:diketogulonate reductase-like aldo/keto reductase